MNEMIGLGPYQSCENRGSLVFGLRWCRWVWGLDKGLEGLGGVMSVRVVSLDYLCSWQV